MCYTMQNNIGYIHVFSTFSNFSQDCAVWIVKWSQMVGLGIEKRGYALYM